MLRLFNQFNDLAGDLWCFKNLINTITSKHIRNVPHVDIPSAKPFKMDGRMMCLHNGCHFFLLTKECHQVQIPYNTSGTPSGP